MQRARPHDRPLISGSPGDLLRLIRAGEVESRADIARVTGLAPSTVSLRVDALMGLGLIREDGEVGSRGGRRSRRISLDPGAGVVGAVDLGAHHARIAISDMTGSVLASTDALEAITAAAQPAEVVEVIWSQLHTLLKTVHDQKHDDPECVAISVPAPVAYPSGRLQSPSFRPDWHDVDLPQLFAQHTKAPVLVENDGNLIALAEHHRNPTISDLISVKVGSRIGAGIVIDGKLYRGGSGAAGEFSHSSVDGTSVVGCACGVPNCLESVASGRAMATRLAAQGQKIPSTPDLLAAIARGDVEVVAILRECGAQIGRALASIVNFVNPQMVVIAGSLGSAPQLVAAIRSELYGRCLPFVAETLEVRASGLGPDAAVLGATQLALDELLCPARVDARVQAS
ncbi:ROK family transcriptional regulator [Humibacter ginsenosidimutans]|uniref:ROK family transcriptional regulator n=1 Tax=Humibacter ginsenosidimutans TaxID=2599293 RepID=A0A5B8M9A1_9MICO|nr:ROK family transcriptional regulator [Humibacter ginsenosidimutans]QDZ15990.1 ROK family transcriptional regulator [Humibacter ginsenosidimutans]